MQQYQVSELTKLLKSLIGQSFPEYIMVHGEVTGFSRASSGHMYFTLKDEDSKLKAVYFKQSIRSDSFIPKNGDKVSAIGELNLYESEGNYQLMVRKVIYSNEGEFWRKFEETKLKLASLGYFDPTAKRSIPDYPHRVALLTALTGAAIRDFIVTTRSYGSFFHIDLWSIPVQGKDSVPAVVKAITHAGMRSDIYDVLVLTRGGGSLDDLALFNEEKIAVALKNSAVPTISAIGHEQDVSICDMVADERVATPTAAAERLTKAYKASMLAVEMYYQRILRTASAKLENTVLRIDRFDSRLQAVGPLAKLEKSRMRINIATESLIRYAQGYLSEHRRKIERAELQLAAKRPDFISKEAKQYIENLDKLLYNNIKGRVRNLSQKVDISQILLSTSAKECFTSHLHRLAMLKQRLESANPDDIMSRGYALVAKEGKIISCVDDVALEEEIEIKMKDGYLFSFVTGKRKAIVKNEKID